MNRAAPSANGPSVSRVLLTGATGYVGGRLAPRLLQAGYQVRCLVRSRRKLTARPWARDDRVEIVEADLCDADQGRRRPPAALGWGVAIGPDGSRPPAQQYGYHLVGAHP